MINIILIDNGLCQELCHSELDIRQFTIFDSKHSVEIKEDYSYSNMHGTCMLHTIDKYMRKQSVKYTMINIMNENNESCSGMILAALKFIYNKLEADYILMGVSFSSGKNVYEIANYAKKLTDKGVVLIAPVSRLECNIYPASIPAFTTVKAGMFAENITYYDLFEDIYIGNVLPEFIRMNNHRYHLFSGTSLASARCLAFIINTQGRVSDSGYYQKVNNLDVNNFYRCSYNKHNYRIIRDYLKAEKKLTDIYSYKLSRYENIELLHLFTYEEIDLFIYKVLHDAVDLGKLNYLDFRSIYDLSIFMENAL